METQRNLKIGDLLVEQGLITLAQLNAALEKQKATDKRIGEILVDQEAVDEKEILKIIAGIYRLPIIDLENCALNEKLLSSFPSEILDKHKVLPIEIKDNNLIVATSDPLDVVALQEIRYISGHQVRPVLAGLKDITARLKRSHESRRTFQAIRNAQSVDPQETPILKLVSSVLSQAIKEGASDIHFEPQKENLRVRFRIDGILFEKVSIPQDLSRKVISRLKIMAGMDVAENRKPQDGRISWQENGQNFDIRVSTLLDMNGETISLRILNEKTISHTLESLGLGSHEIEQIKKFITRPHGMVLVTGPTGAGKTTTLYSILNELNKISTNIITVEDPVEYQLEGITQTNINNHTGYSFANAIRHILRHDPNIIMVGEIRDIETAEVSVRAALTGHLVLATLHTNSAAGAVTRLLEMNVEPFLLSSTLIGVVAQRLIRRLCPYCKKESKASAEVEALIAAELSVKGPITVADPVGCEKCFHTGYAGRIGLFEILKVTPDLRHLILKKTDDQEITNSLVASGSMQTLRMAGYKKVIEKVTSYAEVMRVTLTENIG